MGVANVNGPPITLEMIALLLEANKQLGEANHKSTNDKIDQQNIIIRELKDLTSKELAELKDLTNKDVKEIKESAKTKCDTCAKILVIKTTLGYQWGAITLLAGGLVALAKLWYDAQGKIMEYISGVVK